jgi:hypothetical protein
MLQTGKILLELNLQKVCNFRRGFFRINFFVFTSYDALEFGGEETKERFTFSTGTLFNSS